MEIEVSVIVPAFNAGRFVRETVESVLSQSYKNFELILVDHASEDETLHILKEFEARDQRVRVLQLLKNLGGPAHPRNKGAEIARGRFLAFLDSDDVWEPDKLERQLSFMSVRNLNFSSTGRSLIDAHGLPMRESLRSRLYSASRRRKTLGDLLKGNFITTSSVIIDRLLHVGFNEGIEYSTVEDFDSWLQAMVKGQTNFQYLDEKLVRYRFFGGSATDRSNAIRQELKAHKVIVEFLIEHSEYARYWAYRFHFSFMRKLFKRAKK